MRRGPGAAHQHWTSRAFSRATSVKMAVPLLSGFLLLLLCFKFQAVAEWTSTNSTGRSPLEIRPETVGGGKPVHRVSALEVPDDDVIIGADDAAAMAASADSSSTQKLFNSSALSVDPAAAQRLEMAKAGAKMGVRSTVFGAAAGNTSVLDSASGALTQKVFGHVRSDALGTGLAALEAGRVAAAGGNLSAGVLSSPVKEASPAVLASALNRKTAAGAAGGLAAGLKSAQTSTDKSTAAELKLGSEASSAMDGAADGALGSGAAQKSPSNLAAAAAGGQAATAGAGGKEASAEAKTSAAEGQTSGFVAGAVEAAGVQAAAAAGAVNAARENAAAAAAGAGTAGGAGTGGGTAGGAVAGGEVEATAEADIQAQVAAQNVLLGIKENADATPDPVKLEESWTEGVAMISAQLEEQARMWPEGGRSPPHRKMPDPGSLWSDAEGEVSAQLAAQMGILKRGGEWERGLGQADGKASRPGTAENSVESLELMHKLTTVGLQSSHECREETSNPLHRVCIFNNTILYNGEMYYITKDPSVKLPPVAMSWFSEDEMRVRVVDRLPFEASESLQAESVSQAVLFHLIHFNNYYHILSESVPTLHTVACSYLGACSYDTASPLRIFFVEERPENWYWFRGMPGAEEAWECISPQPVDHIRSPLLKDKVVVLRTAVAGLGPNIRAFHQWQPRYQQSWGPLSPPMAASWRTRLAHCLNIDFPNLQAPQQPMNVLLLDRHYSSGRHMLNVHDILTQVKWKFTGANVQLRYLDGMSLRDQALLFANTSIVVWPHGAAMANLVLLPQGAAGVELLPWPGQEHQLEWSRAIQSEYALRLKLVQVANPYHHLVRFNLEAMWGDPDYHRMTPDEKVALQESGTCPATAAEKCAFRWMHYSTSFVQDWELLERALNRAWAFVREPTDANLPAEVISLTFE